MSGSNRKMTVKSRKLDSLLEELNVEKIDLFKIDVEGAELKVLKGSRNTLRKGTEIIVESFQPITIQRYLESLDYSYKFIDKRNFYAYKDTKPIL
jgi:hypothetical protein